MKIYEHQGPVKLQGESKKLRPSGEPEKDFQKVIEQMKEAGKMTNSSAKVDAALRPASPIAGKVRFPARRRKRSDPAPKATAAGNPARKALSDSPAPRIHFCEETRVYLSRAEVFSWL